MKKIEIEWKVTKRRLKTNALSNPSRFPAYSKIPTIRSAVSGQCSSRHSYAFYTSAAVNSCLLHPCSPFLVRQHITPELFLFLLDEFNICKHAVFLESPR